MKKIFFFTFFVILYLPCTVFGEELFLKNHGLHIVQKTDLTFISQEYFSIGLEQRFELLKNEKALTYEEYCRVNIPFYGTFETIRNNLKSLTKIDIKTDTFRGNLTLFYPGAKLYLGKNGVLELNTDHLEIELTVTFPIQ